MHASAGVLLLDLSPCTREAESGQSHYVTSSASAAVPLQRLTVDKTERLSFVLKVERSILMSFFFSFLVVFLVQCVIW